MSAVATLEKEEKKSVEKKVKKQNVKASQTANKSETAKTPQGADSATPFEDLTISQIGVLGESIADKFLESRGLKILERNWTCFCGEADLIVQDGEEVAFVEVKTRVKRNDEDQIPEFNVTKRKRDKYKKIIAAYAAQHPEQDLYRFDVLAIILKSSRNASVHYIKGIYLDDDNE